VESSNDEEKCSIAHVFAAALDAQRLTLASLQDWA
jgi:hypothetical protein